MFKSSMGELSDNCSSQERLLAQEVEDWSTPGSSLYKDGDTDDNSNSRSYGVESEEIEGWLPSSRRNSTASNVSSGIYLSDDSNYCEDNSDSGNVGVIDSFYAWIGLGSVSVKEIDSQDSNPINTESDTDSNANEREDRNESFAADIGTKTEAIDDLCSVDDEASLSTSSTCSSMREHVINNINSNGVTVDEEQTV